MGQKVLAAGGRTTPETPVPCLLKKSEVLSENVLVSQVPLRRRGQGGHGGLLSSCDQVKPAPGYKPPLRDLSALGKATSVSFVIKLQEF